MLKAVGARPQIGWQIDPFGDSSITPLLYRQMGYSALVNDRISLRLKEARMDSRELQFLWKDAPSPNVDAELFTHTLDSWYWQPAQFNWDEGAPPVDADNIECAVTACLSKILTCSLSYAARWRRSWSPNCGSVPTTSARLTCSIRTTCLLAVPSPFSRLAHGGAAADVCAAGLATTLPLTTRTLCTTTWIS